MVFFQEKHPNLVWTCGSSFSINANRTSPTFHAQTTHEMYFEIATSNNSSVEQHPFYLPKTVLLLLLLLLGWSDLQLEETSMLCRFLATEGYRELAWSAIGWILVRGMTWPMWVEGCGCQCFVDFFGFLWIWTYCRDIPHRDSLLISRIFVGIETSRVSNFFLGSSQPISWLAACHLKWYVLSISGIPQSKPEGLKIVTLLIRNR